MSKSQVAWFIGLVTCICGAILGQAELVGEPWRHWISVIFIAGTAVSGYLLQPPRNPEQRTRADDPSQGVAHAEVG